MEDRADYYIGVGFIDGSCERDICVCEVIG
jgi:hypothetical protein